LTHHPQGKALADLHSVMDLQAEVLAGYGVPINIAEKVIKPRISEVGRSVISGNYNRYVDFAAALNLDLMCVHTPCDNLGARFMVDLIAKKKPEFVSELLEVIKGIPEYREAGKLNAGPTLFAGSPENSCGKIAVTEFTGGTEGAKEIYEKMAQAGIGTIIGMHLSEKHREEAEKNHLNVVIAGHMSSDSLGMNLFLDELEKKGIEIIPLAGLIRIKRSHK
jgi:putative NIF3 family GTP cyclohydrolase 1 type 2